MAKLNLGMLQQGKSASELKATFDICEVVENLYRIRSELQEERKGDTPTNQKDQENAIAAALVRSEGENTNATF